MRKLTTILFLLLTTAIFGQQHGMMTLAGQGGLKSKAVAVWEFGETSGSTLDDETANALDLTLVNPTSYNGGAPANLENSIRFVSSTSNPAAYHVDDALFSIGGGKAFSFSIWVDFTYTGIGVSMLGSKVDRDLANEWMMYVYGTTGAIEFQIYEEGSTSTNIKYISDASVISTNAGWQHIVVTYDGLGQTDSGGIYVDGVDVYASTDGTAITGASDTGAQFRIGTLDDGFFDPNAYISQSAFFEGVLTQYEILQLYNSGSGLTYNNW